MRQRRRQDTSLCLWTLDCVPLPRYQRKLLRAVFFVARCSTMTLFLSWERTSYGPADSLVFTRRGGLCKRMLASGRRLLLKNWRVCKRPCQRSVRMGRIEIRNDHSASSDKLPCRYYWVMIIRPLYVSRRTFYGRVWAAAYWRPQREKTNKLLYLNIAYNS